MTIGSFGGLSAGRPSHPEDSRDPEKATHGGDHIIEKPGITLTAGAGLQVRRNVALFKKWLVRDCRRFPVSTRSTRSSISDQSGKSVVIEIAFIPQFPTLNPNL